MLQLAYAENVQMTLNSKTTAKMQNNHPVWEWYCMDASVISLTSQSDYKE